MAFSINRVTLLGNLTKEPDLRYTPSGKAVLSLNLATNRSIKNNDAWTDVATFHRVIVWGKIAEYIAKTVHKGQQIYVDGRIDNRSYDKDGTKHYISEVVAENVIPMSISREKSTGKPVSSQPDTTPPEEPGSETINGKPAENVNPDDIPF